MSDFEKGMGGRVLQGIFASRQAALIFPASQIQMLAGKLIFAATKAKPRSCLEVVRGVAFSFVVFSVVSKIQYLVNQVFTY